eukprot:3772867-Prymnesium_polylepis.1
MDDLPKGYLYDSEHGQHRPHAIFGRIQASGTVPHCYGTTHGVYYPSPPVPSRLRPALSPRCCCSGREATSAHSRHAQWLGPRCRWWAGTGNRCNAHLPPPALLMCDMVSAGAGRSVFTAGRAFGS